MQEGENAMILKTFITETNDLFIYVKQEMMYKVYMIDLDDSNIAEMEGDTEKMKNIFNPILIL